MIYPNQYYTDFGGGAGNQFKHIFIGSERILTKKARVAPDRQHWYYHTDHLHSTGTVTNENGQMVDAVHYFPFGEVWLEEVPASLPVDYFFTAKELDQETGFYDFGARYLDPRFSKWMTADPALAAYLPGAGGAGASLPSLGGAFRSANLALYGYSHHNPATLFDPNGRETATYEFYGPNGVLKRRETYTSANQIYGEFAKGIAKSWIQGAYNTLWFIGNIGCGAGGADSVTCHLPAPDVVNPPSNHFQEKGWAIGPGMLFGIPGAAFTRGAGAVERDAESLVTWVDEGGNLRAGGNPGMKPNAYNFQSGAPGARSNFLTGRSQAPYLSFKDKSGNVIGAKFDGVQGRELIDRKLNPFFSAKAIDEAKRQAAVAQHYGLQAVWELPDQAAVNAANRFMQSNNITGITVRLAP